MECFVPSGFTVHKPCASPKLRSTYSQRSYKILPSFNKVECPSNNVLIPICVILAPSASIRYRLHIICRLHMQYFGWRVELNTIPPSGRYSGSISDTPSANVSCFNSEPSILISLLTFLFGGSTLLSAEQMNPKKITLTSHAKEQLAGKQILYIEREQYAPDHHNSSRPDGPEVQIVAAMVPN